MIAAHIYRWLNLLLQALYCISRGTTYTFSFFHLVSLEAYGRKITAIVIVFFFYFFLLLRPRAMKWLSFNIALPSFLLAATAIDNNREQFVHVDFAEREVYLHN